MVKWNEKNSRIDPIVGSASKGANVEPWKCKQCGKCCQFIVIPVVETISGETMEYLEAHGIAVAGNKLLIPARCEHLRPSPQPSPSGGGRQGGGTQYECAIHACKFKNCKAGGEKECKEAQRQWSSLHQK